MEVAGSDDSVISARPSISPTNSIPSPAICFLSAADARAQTYVETIRRSLAFRRERSWPIIRFTSCAWAKLRYLRDAGDTEIGGFAVTFPGDPLMVEDVCLVRQRCSPVTVEFNDESVADFFDEQVDAGLKPEQFGRIWGYTHPGDSAEPSLTDEETFERCFGNVNWAVMLILARGGETYARLQFNVGPQSAQRANVEVDYTARFDASDESSWQREFKANVIAAPINGSCSPELDCTFDAVVSEVAAGDDPRWLGERGSDPLFLDWEDDTCPERLSTIPA